MAMFNGRRIRKRILSAFWLSVAVFLLTWEEGIIPRYQGTPDVHVSTPSVEPGVMKA